MNEVEEVQTLDSDSRGHANNTNSDRTSLCYQDIQSDKLFISKPKEHQDSMDHNKAEQMEDSSNTEPVITPALQFNIKEESGSVCLEDPDIMSRDIDSPTGASVVSFVLNGDEQQLSGDTLDPDRKSYYLDTGDGSTVRKRKVRKPMKLSDRPIPCKSMTPKVQEKMLPSFDRKRTISHMQSEDYQQLPEEQETLWQSSNSQIPCSSSDKRRPAYAHESSTSSQSECVTGFVKAMSHSSDTALTSKMYSSPESMQSLLEIDNNIAHLKTNAQKEQFICIECGESFSEMEKFLMHETMHVGESYYCTLCGKNFNERGVFIRHQRVHLRDKPFPCSVCGASFNEKAVLLRHQIIHTGEKPFQCSVCGKSYNRKDTLMRHQTIHMKDSY